MRPMSEPRAVLISDIHFTVPTLELATASLVAARDEAWKRNLPLVVCGDTLDGKALVRGECANRLIDILSSRRMPTMTYFIVGNHDLLNEKGEAHALNFLGLLNGVQVIQTPLYLKDVASWIIPYQSSPDKLQGSLNDIPVQSRIIMHQGVAGAFMGSYVQDKTSLPPEAFAEFRVISGHYHRRQDIKTGRPRKGAVGLFSYVGNPYSLSFAEANDGSKGFQILHDDGLMTFVPTNLRKHIILNRTVDTVLDEATEFKPGDLVWMKVTGPHSELEKLSKKIIGESVFGHCNFKFDKVPTDTISLAQDPPKGATDEQLLDLLIDEQQEPDSQKLYLKTLWKDLYNAHEI